MIKSESGNSEFISCAKRILSNHGNAVKYQNKLLEKLLKHFMCVDEEYVCLAEFCDALDDMVPKRIIFRNMNDDDRKLCRDMAKRRLCNLGRRLFTLNLKNIATSELLKRIEFFMRLSAGEAAFEIECCIRHINASDISLNECYLDNLSSQLHQRIERNPTIASAQEGVESEFSTGFIMKVMRDEIEGYLEVLKVSWDARTLDVGSSECFSGLEFKLCDADDLRVCIDKLERKLNKRTLECLEKIESDDGFIKLVEVPLGYCKIIIEFRARFPHMSEFADDIENNLALTCMGAGSVPLQLFPTICVLDGPPGVGKSAAVTWLANELQVLNIIIGCAELSNGFDISGQSAGWSTGKSGLISEALLEKQCANPIVILDELDKLDKPSNVSPPGQALYTLLEKGSANRFKDEFYNFEMDASAINWIGTSNHYSLIPAPIKDRARKIYVPVPNRDQKTIISTYVFQDIRTKNDAQWGKYFAPLFSLNNAEILASVDGLSIRGMQKVVYRCFTIIARREADIKHEAGSLIVQENDVLQAIDEIGGGSTRTRIGFI